MEKEIKFSELQNILTNILRRPVTKGEIANALNYQPSNLSMRISRNDSLNDSHKKNIEEYFDIKLDCENRISADEIIYIPSRGELSASLGSGREVFSEEVTEKFPIPKSLLAKIGASPEHCCIINTDGVSMYPTIIGGQDQIMIDTSKKEIYDGKIYVFRMENSLFAKRLQKLPNRKIKVISDNPEFESYIVDLNDENANFDIIGRVMWISRIC